MSEKVLTVSDWKSFAKGEKLDDKEASKDSKALHEAVLKALQDLSRKDEAKHDAMLAGLKDLEDVLTKQIAANARRKDKDGKAIKDTKDVKDQLYKMLAAVEKQRKEVGAARDAGGEDEEEDSPALLTKKMVPLIRELNKGDVVMQALIAVAGKETVVLLSRKPISPARGKLLKDQLTNPGGLKFIRAECMLEKAALTFVVQQGASGLAKRIKAALLLQTLLRLKVRVRGEEPDDVDEDDDADGDADGDAEAGGATVSAEGAAAQAAERWKSSRAEVSAAVKSIAADIARARHPRSAAAIAELQQMLARLPVGAPGADESAKLREWLDSDGLVSDFCELVGDIRTPLTQALAQLEARQAA